MNSFYLRELAFLPILAITVYTDVKERKITNKTLLFGLGVGLFASILLKDYEAIIESFILLILLLFLFSRHLGGGDIKLLTILPLFVKSTSIYFFYLGLLYLFFYFCRQKKKNEETESRAFAPVIGTAYLVYLAHSFYFSNTL